MPEPLKHHMHTLNHVLARLDVATAQRSPAELAAHARLDPEWDPLIVDEAAAIAAEHAVAGALSAGVQAGAAMQMRTPAAALAGCGYGLVMNLLGRPVHEVNELDYNEFSDALEAWDWAVLLPVRVLDTGAWVTLAKRPPPADGFDGHALLVDAFAVGVVAAVVEHDLSAQRPG